MWHSQLSYEEHKNIPNEVYLVWVKDPYVGKDGGFGGMHTDISSPQDIIVVTKLGTIPNDDKPMDFGRFQSIKEKFIQNNQDKIIQLLQNNNIKLSNSKNCIKIADGQMDLGNDSARQEWNPEVSNNYGDVKQQYAIPNLSIGDLVVLKTQGITQ